MSVEVILLLVGAVILCLLIALLWRGRQYLDENEAAHDELKKNVVAEVKSVIEATTELNNDQIELLALLKTDLKKSIDAKVDVIEIAAENSKLVEQNAILREKHSDYKRFFTIALETIREDTTFMRSSLFQRFGSVDEYQDINRQIQAFQARLDAMEAALREYKMIETYEDE